MDLVRSGAASVSFSNRPMLSPDLSGLRIS
jgi:hypothetical protein